MNLHQLESRDMPSTIFALSDTLRAFRNGVEQWSVQPYKTWTGPINLSSGDVNGDGVPDAIVGAGFGGGPHVRVLDGRDGSELESFFAYDPKFTGGVYVGYNIGNDDIRNVITGAGPGGGPHIKGFSGIPLRETQSFFAGPADYTGGVRVAGNGVPEIFRPVAMQSRPVGARASIYLGFGKDAPTELIPGIYQQVANAFAPFNVNITTIQPTGPANTWATVVIGGNGSRFAPGDLTEEARGIAVVNGFFQSNAFESAVAHVFADRIGWGNPVMIGRAIAHEAAHLFGADHVSDPSSIMFTGLGTGPGRFDRTNAGILLMRFGGV